MSQIHSELDAILHSNLSELFYTHIGSTWTLDTVNLYVIEPLALIGFLFNLVCCALLALSKDLRSVGLYRYIIAYALNNTMMCFVPIFAFSSFAPRYFPLFCSTFSRVHRCLMAGYVSPTLYFVARIIEMLIVCDRLANFKPIFKRIVHHLPVHILPLVYLACALINLPLMFARLVKSDDQLLHDLRAFNTTRSISLCARDPFMTKPFGNAIMLTSTFVRDFVTLGVEVALRCTLSVCFRRFLDAKALHTRAASTPRPQDVSFRRTTLTITRFSVLSILANVANLIGFLVIALSYNTLVAVETSLFLTLLFITKPIMTIFILFKLDKNLSRLLVRSSKAGYEPANIAHSIRNKI